MAEKDRNATKKAGITPAKPSQAGKTAEQPSAPATTVYKPPLGQAPSMVPPLALVPEPEPKKEPDTPTPLLTEIKELIKSAVNSLARIAHYSAPPEDALIAYPSTTVTAATALKPAGPDVIASGGSPGYDRIGVYFEELPRVSDKVWAICDGPGSLFVTATNDFHKWSGEDEIKPGEFRAFTSVYELRVRSPNAATRYRVTEYEPDLAVVANQGSFTAQNIAAPFPAPGTNLPNIPVPSGFALVVRANVNNPGQVFIAGPVPAGSPPNPPADAVTNAGVAATRNTLNAGDRVQLFVTNANLAAVLGSAAGNTVDVLVEQ